MTSHVKESDVAKASLTTGTIDKIEITTFTVDIKNFARNYKSNVVGGSMVYTPGAVYTRPVLLVRIFTSDGLVGEYGNFATTGTVDQAVVAAKVAVGNRWHERELIWRTARRAGRPSNSYGLSFVDNALWDLAGKAYNASLSQLLGGFREAIPAYASCHNGDRLDNLPDKEAVADFFIGLKEKGWKGFKMHSWHEGNKWEEAENVAYMREKLGERTELMLDPACVFDSISDAIFVGKACEEAGFRWFEDPLRPLGVGIHQHKALREALDIPILQTEHVTGPEAKADFLLAGGTDILRADAHYDLGVTGCLKTIRFAESLGVSVEMHGPSPVHRHLVAAMQSTTMYECANVSPAMDDPSPEIYTCGYSDNVNSIGKDGTLTVPNRPGIGVEYDADLIRRNHQATETITAG
ncbi:enolase C-terminal domain-like protein [Shinella sp. BYT-45]|uniref:enolase C-terminal domain-like protein n=1 Tax=Shinella sp. BYT-45 TaxID=3377377 RepID=UPI003980CE77